MAEKTDQPKAEPKAKQQPSIGRVVHFVYGSQHVPALITDPAAPVVPLFDEDGNEREPQQALTVFPVGSAPFTTVAAEDADGAPGTWHWPEYVPAT